MDLQKDIVLDLFHKNAKKGGDFVELKGDSGRIWGAVCFILIKFNLIYFSFFLN